MVLRQGVKLEKFLFPEDKKNIASPVGLVQLKQDGHRESWIKADH